MIGPDVRPPVICASCHADEMGCGVKLGLSGRRCCGQCGHDCPTPLDSSAPDPHPEDRGDHRDQDHVDLHDHDHERKTT